MKNEKRLQVYCPYSVLDLGWEKLKKLQNITFEKPWYLSGNKGEIYRKDCALVSPEEIYKTE